MERENTIYVVLKEDIVYYPPIISLLRHLIKLNYRVVFLGIYSDTDGKEKLKAQGVGFVNVTQYDVNANLINKLFKIYRYKRDIIRYFKGVKLKTGDYIWLAQNENVRLLYKLVEKYPTIIHQLEYTTPNVSLKYKLSSPFVNLSAIYRKASKVVCCEYNRAQITKGQFDLRELPYILPNKTDIEFNATEIPCDIKPILKEAFEFIQNRKIIIYQGVFSKTERRLDEFCEAIKILPDDFGLIIMGRETGYYQELKKKYSSDKIKFLPFIRPPYYLHVTSKAYIGVLTYFSSPKSMASVINPIYCAPNKIYEYARFGIPMIGNDIPGLYYRFKEHNCGEIMTYPITSHKIMETILKIDLKYEEYSNGATSLFKSDDIDSILKTILTTN